MATAPVLELDQLAAPIPGDHPAGTPRTHDLEQKLKEAREKGQVVNPPKKELWSPVVILATDALAKNTKDMVVAARLIEGATLAYGFAGLRDSLSLMTRLLAEFWDKGLHPAPELGEDPEEKRQGSLLWLNERGSGSNFPFTLLTVPFIRTKTEAYSHLDWRSPTKRAEVEAALLADPKKSGMDRAKVIDAYEDLTAAQVELAKLGEEVDRRMAKAEINLLTGTGSIGNALEECKASLKEVLTKLGVGATTAGEAAADESQSGSPGTSETTSYRSTGMSRDDLYRQIDAIAESLQRMEPHSPVPLLLKRAVKLGALPFPELIRDIMNQRSDLDQLDQLLGVTKKE